MSEDEKDLASLIAKELLTDRHIHTREKKKTAAGLEEKKKHRSDSE